GQSGLARVVTRIEPHAPQDPSGLVGQTLEALAVAADRLANALCFSRRRALITALLGGYVQRGKGLQELGPLLPTLRLVLRSKWHLLTILQTGGQQLVAKRAVAPVEGAIVFVRGRLFAQVARLWAGNPMRRLQREDDARGPHGLQGHLESHQVVFAGIGQ